MGVRIIHDTDQGRAALYCSTSGWAFGPTFDYDRKHEADHRLEAFLGFIEKVDGRDPRKLSDKELDTYHTEFLAQEESMWERLES